MATWGSAFLTAFKILLFSFIWGVLGLILIIAGAATVGRTLGDLFQSLVTGSTLIPEIDFVSIGIGLLLFLIGYLIILLGTAASFLKYSAEYYAREFQRSTQAQAPPPY